mgnify:CR=1 FL=1
MYVLAGAYYFQNSENWSYWNAVYFCVVTLTTIGFGDFVPKTNAQGDRNPEISIVVNVCLILSQDCQTVSLNPFWSL